MFKARERPGGRHNKSADILIDHKAPVYLRKPEIVADTETKAQIAKGKACESVARSKTLLFFDGRDRIQVRLTIFRSDSAVMINKNQGIVN